MSQMFSNERRNLCLKMQRLFRHPAPKTARMVPPNAGIEAWYARNLKALVRQMATATEREVKAAFRDYLDGGLAQDAKPGGSLDAAWARILEAIFGRMSARLNEAAGLFASRLGRRVAGYTSKNVTAALKEAGFIVNMRLSARETVVISDIIRENVELLFKGPKSLSKQYFERVRDAVGESVAKGRDLAGLTKALTETKEITLRRAELIARDQNNKATEALTRTRYQELGLNRAIWRHMRISRIFRPTHMAMNGQEFDLNEGMFDPDPKVSRNILPAELPNCRCQYRIILPRLTPSNEPASGATSAITVLERAA